MSAKTSTLAPLDDFSEVDAWAGVGEGWQHLHGNFQSLGYSLEWHDFTTDEEFDWSRTFHPGSVEICLNLTGTGIVESSQGKMRSRLELAPLTAGFYIHDGENLRGTRAKGERHQFITVELSRDFLQHHFPENQRAHLQPILRKFLSGDTAAAISDAARLTGDTQQLVISLRRPPVYAVAHRLWYLAKALEVASALFYRPEGENDLFCQRQKGQNYERVQKVIALLRGNLSEPFSLEEIGKQVGCSHYYLSRLFTQEMGKPIFQYLRDLRMDRAAELLRERRLNVTQVALEVGYSSPSHFSTAFHESFGCCPGLYPLATSPQTAVRNLKKSRKQASDNL